MKRVFLAFLYLTGFMTAWAAVLLAGILALKASGSNGGMLWFILGSFAAILLTFLPFFNYALKRVFLFRGEGEPLPLGQLKEELLALNEFDAPIVMELRKEKLVTTWRYADAKWWEILSKAGLDKVYELHVKFDESRHEALLVDVMKNVSWDAGPCKANLSGGFFRGINFEVSIGKQWGIRENFEVGKILDYRFSPEEIKNPVLNTLLRHGWDVRMGMW